MVTYVILANVEIAVDRLVVPVAIVLGGEATSVPVAVHMLATEWLIVTQLMFPSKMELVSITWVFAQ